MQRDADVLEIMMSYDCSFSSILLAVGSLILAGCVTEGFTRKITHNKILLAAGFACLLLMFILRGAVIELHAMMRELELYADEQLNKFETLIPLVLFSGVGVFFAMLAFSRCFHTKPSGSHTLLNAFGAVYLGITTIVILIYLYLLYKAKEDYSFIPERETVTGIEMPEYQAN